MASLFKVRGKTVLWRPNPGPQTVALSRQEFELGVGGARFGGKSELGRHWLVEDRYIKHPEYAGLVIRKNYTDLSEWIERAKHDYAHLGAKFTGTTTTVIRFPSGAYIRTGHLKEEDAYEKYQGHAYQKLLLEEATQIPFEKWYVMLMSACRTTTRDLPAQIMTNCNPGGPGHLWYKKRFIDVAFNKPYLTNPNDPIERQRWRVFIQIRLKDNPAGAANDPGYESYLDSIPDEKLRRAWRDGDWDVFVGQFFDKWNSQIHVLPANHPLKPWWNRYRVLDWGYTKPTYCGWLAVDDVGNHYLYREYSPVGEPPKIFAPKVLRMTGPEEKIVTTIADPSIWQKTQYGEDAQQATRSIQMELGDNGLFCIKANNDRIIGWNMVKSLLYWDEQGVKPQFYVLENCKYAIESIPTLVHDDNKVEDLDTDGEDHPADAIRYGVMHTCKTTRPKRELTVQQQELAKFFNLPTKKHKEWAETL